LLQTVLFAMLGLMLGLASGVTPYTHEWGGYASDGGELHPDVLRAHATKYAQSIASNPKYKDVAGTAKLRKVLEDHIDELTELEKNVGKDQITEIRTFVKAVGSKVVEKPEYAHDAPLHEVLIRADEVLGLEDDPDQDAHPYKKGRVILQTMIKFFRETLKSLNLIVAKDEL